MSTKYLVAGLLVIIGIVGIVAVMASSGQYQAPQNQTADGNTIEITADGFSPNTLTIKTGDTVTWINKDTAAHWPATGPHPQHTGYPEPGGCISSKFDACKGLAQGETFSFKFDLKGTWKYHDHINPGLYGTIVVE